MLRPPFAQATPDSIKGMGVYILDDLAQALLVWLTLYRD
jgi:hypothetical protein